MIVDRYPAENIFEMVPHLTIAMDPILARIDTLLDDDVLFAQVKQDCLRRHPRSASAGRHSTPVDVILRMLLVRRLYNWSYEQTEQLVSDSLVLRQFCHVFWQRVPDDTTLIRWSNSLSPATIEQLHNRLVALATAQRITRGRKLRTDGTVVETTIHYPADSGLLADAARLLGRLARRAHAILGAEVPARLVADWSRSATRLAWAIGESGRRRGETATQIRTGLYRRLLRNSRTMHRRSQELRERLATVGALGAGLLDQYDHALPLVAQGIAQAARRLAGEQVPAREKIVSLFEPHTDIIPRAKVRQPVEFGHKIWLDEVDGGIISGYRVLAGNPAEAPQLIASVRAHQERFGHMPDLVTADRGCHAAGAEEILREMGVRRVAVPAQGPITPERRRHEHQRWFRAARRFRAGIEGRISVAKRRGWLGRCRDHGKDGFDRWIGWGVLVANLVTIGRHDPIAQAC